MALVFPAPAQIKNLLDPTANGDAATKYYVDRAVTNPSGDVTIANLTVTNNSNLGDTIVTGNLTVTGTTLYANIATLNIKDPVIEQGGNPNGSPLTSNDGVDRGQLLHYYNGSAIDAFMGWKNGSNEFVFASNATLSTNTVTVIQYGNVHVGYIIGNGSSLTSLTGSNVTGEVSYANTANTVAGANVTGTVANANYAAYAGNVTIAAQSNITSLGTLSNLTSNGTVSFTNATNVSLGSIANLHISGGTADYFLQTDGAGNVSWAAQTGTSSVIVDSFTGDGTSSTFTLSATPANINVTSVNYNGASLLRDSYLLSGSSIIFAGAPAIGSKIEVTTTVPVLGGTTGASKARVMGYNLVFGG
jgi:hypothetical protein